MSVEQGQPPSAVGNSAAPAALSDKLEGQEKSVQGKVL